ncbi:MAG: hypothetical protein FJX74_01435 [Armatimonadetes bacterium]|nr:hypothetical protein [Armatimonadota bacterium]
MPGYREDVAAIARAACLAHKSGARVYVKNGIEFDLVTPGWCGRFVRQCYAAAARNVDPDFNEFGFGWLRRYASESCRALESMGYRTDTPQPGDIVGMSPDYRTPGHIGIYLGAEVAENTSSLTRGPGTVLSPLSRVRHVVTGYYAVFPSRSGSPAQPNLEVVGLDGRIISCHASETDGSARVDLRPVAEALGYECHYRVWEDGRRRVYLKSP